MALSPLDSPPYVPDYPPQTPLVDVQMAQDWVKREFDKIARYATAQPGTLFFPNTTPPSRPRTGMEAYADGAHWNPGSGEGLYVFKGGVWTPVAVGGGNRIRLAVDTNFYVDTVNGNDANAGLAPGAGACKTFAAMMSKMAQLYDFGGRNITLNLSGTFTESITLQPLLGALNLTIDFNACTVATVGLHCISSNFAHVNNVFLRSTGGPATLSCSGTTANVNISCLHWVGAGNMNFTGSAPIFNFGSSSGVHILVNSPASSLTVGTYRITGDAAIAHIQMIGGLLRNTSALTIGAKVSVIGNRNLAIFCWNQSGIVLQQGVIFDDGAGGAPVTNNTTKFYCQANGVINTSGASVSYLPGNSQHVPPTDSGGQYL